MNVSYQRRANDLSSRILVLCIGIIGVTCLFVFSDVFDKAETILIWIFFLCSAFSFLYHVLNIVYLTDDGIAWFFCGRLIRKLNWDEIAQVSFIRLFPFSMKTSSTKRILIIPRECEKYDKKHIGICYVLSFRDKIIMFDNTKQNRAYLEHKYGSIEN